MTVCFVDNNIILQLAAYDLFEDAIAALSLTWDDLRVLNTAIHVFQCRNIARNYSPETVQRAIAIVQKCQTLVRQPTDEFELLLKIDGIDEGEASLIAATAAEPAFWLITGDKRCLEVLTNEPSIATIRQRLSGRTICLEQILLKLISVYGSAYVQQQVLAAPDCEMTIKISFGWSTPVDEASILEGLYSYINDLQKQFSKGEASPTQGLLANLT